MVSTPENRGGGSAASNDAVLVPSLAGYSPSSDSTADLALQAKGSWQDIIGPQLAASLPPGWRPPVATFGGDATVYRDLDVTIPPAFVLTRLGTYDRDAIDEQFAWAANYAPLGVYAAIPRTLVADVTDRAATCPYRSRSTRPDSTPSLRSVLPTSRLSKPSGATTSSTRSGSASAASPATRRLRSGGSSPWPSRSSRRPAFASTSSPAHPRQPEGSRPRGRDHVGTVDHPRDRCRDRFRGRGIVRGLLARALLVVIAYLAAFGVFLTGDQSTEIRILRRVGWRRRALVGLVAAQAVALGTLAAGLTVGLVVALGTAAGHRIDGWALAAAALVVLAAHPLSAGVAGLARAAADPAAAARRSSLPGAAFTRAAARAWP